METVLIVLGALAIFVNLVAIIIALLFFIFLYKDVNNAYTLTKLNTGRLVGMEKILISIYTMLSRELVSHSDPSMGPSLPPGWGIAPRIAQRGGKFITEDGRHEADTFEELISKISQDPQYRATREEDIDKLRQTFEDYANENDGLVDEDEDDEDDDDEWKRNKNGDENAPTS